jgi:hypothetical protein
MPQISIGNADQEQLVARSVLVLMATVVLILVFSIVGVFLEAELKHPQALRPQHAGVASELVANQTRSVGSDHRNSLSGLLLFQQWPKSS